MKKQNQTAVIQQTVQIYLISSIANPCCQPTNLKQDPAATFARCGKMWDRVINCDFNNLLYHI